jgi:hypothetical protein
MVTVAGPSIVPPAGATWRVLASSEEDAFAPDPSRETVSVAPLAVTFARPGAVLLEASDE